MIKKQGKQGKTKEDYITEINILIKDTAIFKLYMTIVPLKTKKYIEGNLHTKLRLTTLKKILKTLINCKG